jgi:hypothetical protein
MLNFYTINSAPPKNPGKNVSTENYYANFSKYVLIQPNMQNAPAIPDIPFSYEQFCQKNIQIEKYKLTELKAVAKYYDLHVSGNKPVLVDRILSFFRQTTSAKQIQRIFRGHIVRYCDKLRGPALHNRKICVNETDFYTLEPLAEIPALSFFSYTDSQQYVYGFDLCSIISLISKSNTPANPYNRSPFPYEAAISLYTLYMITKLVFPTILQKDTIPSTIIRKPPLPSPPISDAIQTTSITNPPTDAASALIAPNHAEPLPQITRETRQTEVNNYLTQIRAQPFDTRIRELFIEINLLGNYCDNRWFRDLTRINLSRFYQAYYDWWYIHSRLTPETRSNIYVLDDPFSDVALLYMYPTTTLEDLKEAVLRVMENMVYGGLDIEYRKLGTLQMLSILTIVSIPARASMPWLYESLFS